MRHMPPSQLPCCNESDMITLQEARQGRGAGNVSAGAAAGPTGEAAVSLRGSFLGNEVLLEEAAKRRHDPDHPDEEVDDAGCQHRLLALVPERARGLGQSATSQEVSQ